VFQLSTVYRVLFGDDSELSTQLKDLAEATKFSKKLSRGDPQNGRPQTPGVPAFQARQVQRIWIQIQRSSDEHIQAVKLEKARPHTQQAQSRGEEAKQMGPKNPFK